MTPAHITRLVTFAQHGEPKAYAASDMMRSDLETVLIDATKWQAYEARKQAALGQRLKAWGSDDKAINTPLRITSRTKT